MWENQEIEKITQKQLIDQFGTSGESKFGIYTSTRDIVLKDIVRDIKIEEPFLTDHGADHIANVLDNAKKLLGDDIGEFTGLELYCLIFSILFHDVGNIFNRQKHQETAVKVMNCIWPKETQRPPIYLLLHQIIKAHCGVAGDKTNDTLKEIVEYDQLDNERIRLREIAAIVRFADELAEGPQRTSLFMQDKNRYPPENLIYHEYAKITGILIDRGNNRIALKYTFNLPDSKMQFTNDSKKKFKKLIEYTYKRIIKLDQERQYAKFYSSYLHPFKEVSVALNFLIGDYPENLGLTKLLLTDLVVPGQKQKDIHEYNSEYKIDAIMKKIEKQIPNNK